MPTGGSRIEARKTRQQSPRHLPGCKTVGTYFRQSAIAGTAETKAIEKYMAGLEARIGKTTADAEFTKLLKCIIYAVEDDAAEARAKEQIEVITNEEA